jgi:predicted O-methyltransferase YrrM
MTAFKKLSISLLNRIPYVKYLIEQLEIYEVGNPPGHYYSPIISVEEIRKHKSTIFNRSATTLAGIDLHEDEQLELLEKFKEYYPEVPFEEDKREGVRYYFRNAMYTYSDAIFLFCMLRNFKPRLIIEIGSGFSSAAMLDTNEFFMGNSIHFTFIDPDFQRLYSHIKASDKSNHVFIERNLQDVAPHIFDALEANDILFVDSSHISKTGSDVNMILFEILPRLKPGVLVHFHDVFYPFEYPEEWVLNLENTKFYRGFGYNEDYILRAFLMYNRQFRIVAFNTYLEQFHSSWFEKHMPGCLKEKGGSIWIKKE